MKSLKQGQQCVTHQVVGGPLLMKNFKTLMRDAIGNDYFSTTTLPKAEWANTVYGFQVMSASDDYASAGWSHMGMMECRLVLKCDMVVVGVPSDKVPGATFREKRTNAYSMNPVELKKIFAHFGWAVVFQNGAVGVA